nr:ABC transporter ATP-binding protein [Oceanococcus sp. HetDA_MAG_MS8]
MVRDLRLLLTHSERKQFALILPFAAVLGVVQVASIGSVVPFISMLTRPEMIWENRWLASFANLAGIDSHKTFTLIFGGLILVMLIMANSLAMLSQWWITKFCYDFHRRLSGTLLHNYIHRPYVDFIASNSADLATTVVNESLQVTHGVIAIILGLSCSGVMVIFMLLFLSWLSPVTVLLVATVFAVIYGGMYVVLRRRMERLGQRRLDANKARLKAVNEAFGGLKEVKVLGREDAFVHAFQPHALEFSRSVISNHLLGMIPRYFIETLAFGALLSVVLYFVAADRNLSALLPLASAFAFAGYRMLPAFQSIYRGLTTLKYTAPVLKSISLELTQTWPEGGRAPNPPRMPMEHGLRLDHVSYSYPGSEKKALSDVSVDIAKRSFVAFVGPTGAGKTTLVDVILGLLTPQKGGLIVDNQVITEENRHAWQANMGYVPQDIYLLDDTVIANIAFGVPPSEVNIEAVYRAAKTAKIHEHICAHMENGYATIVGERGVRLSGGQRQRLGIARALYHDPDVLVLDEATSALDQDTERAVHQAIMEMAHVKTVIVIAHRMATVMDCDQIFIVNDGKIVRTGDYSSLFPDEDAAGRSLRNLGKNVRV